MSTNEQPTESQPIPSDYAGQIVAWDSPERNQIVGVGRGGQEAREAARAAGVDQPFLERLPRGDRTFIGFAA